MYTVHVFAKIINQLLIYGDQGSNRKFKYYFKDFSRTFMECHVTRLTK